MTYRLLTARDVAEHVGVSTETVLRWTRRGVLPAIRLPGGALRFRAEALERLLEEWETEVPTPDAGSEPGRAARVVIVPLLRQQTRSSEDQDAC